MEWKKGKPTKPGLVLLEWMNGTPDPVLYVVSRLKDGKLYLCPFTTEDNKPYCIEDKGAVRRHIYIPQPTGDGINGDWHTTDFDPETCEWVSQYSPKTGQWTEEEYREHPRWYDPEKPELPGINEGESALDWLKRVDDFVQSEKEQDAIQT